MSERRNDSVLHAAASAGDLKSLLDTLHKGVDPNLPGLNGATALHHAAFDGHEAIVEVLLSFHADVSAIDHLGLTPLHHAIRNGHRGVAHLLRKHGADLNVFEAATFSDVARLKALLSSNPSLTRCIQPLGWTPLFFASDAQTAHLLVQHGADPNTQDPEGYTALHAAAAKGNLVVARFLLDHGAQVNATYAGGISPLHVAAEEGSWDMVAALLRAGGDACARNHRDQTVLEVAMEAGHVHIAELLKRAGGGERRDGS